ncbi:MAG: phosphoglucomutase/phosphomannomutase family protein [Candidatus Oleimicrobiaceae bacterium]
MRKIRFGTDGWRAIIAEDFTFPRVSAVAQAFATYLVDTEQTERAVAVGYDTRFLSAQFARAIADVLASNGVPTLLSVAACPTPVLSFAVAQRRLAAGVMVTASHNSWMYNGVKFKGDYGGPLLGSAIREIEQRLNKSRPVRRPELIARNLYKVDFFSEYLRQLHLMVRMDGLQGLVVYDAMHGAGSGYGAKLFRAFGIPVTTIARRRDPYFGGRVPEPIPANLSRLGQEVRKRGAVLGMATDGDADRCGVLDEQGRFVELHELFALLFDYLLDSRGWSGYVVRTTSMADTVDCLAAKRGRRVVEVPVGFRNVCQEMLEGEVLLGGEESGGIGFKHHIPERDGLLTMLLVAEMVASKGASMSALVQHLRQECGACSYRRVDIAGSPRLFRQNLTRLRANPPERVGGMQVERVSLMDGLKLCFTNRTWMLMRVSDTEPVARIYVSSPDATAVEQLLKAGQRLLKTLDRH